MNPSVLRWVMAKKTLEQQSDELRALLPPAQDCQYAEIGRLAGLHPTWVSLFARGKVPNPGVVTLDKLTDGIKQWRRAKK